MNVSSGGLSFDFSATNDNLVRIVEQSKQEIQTLADASKTGGKAMDAAFKQAANRLDNYADQMSGALSEQRQAVMALKKEMAQLKAQAGQQSDKGDITASQASMEVYKAKERELQKRRECIQACYDGFDVLEQERQRLEGMRQSSEQAANAQTSLRSQLRLVREQLAQMEATQGVGVRQTEQFRALQAEAGRLADALADAQAQVRVFSDDNAMITGTIAGLSGVAGAFSAAQGAMSLFGVENDKVQEAMLKVQSLMAITTGLQQVANALNKDSAFQLTIVRKAKDLLAASTNKLSVALGISTVAAKALMATLTLGLSVAITALVMLWDKYSNSAKKAATETDATRKAFEEYHNSTAKKAGELVGKYEQLRQQYVKLKTEADKTQWIKDNASAMDSLGLAVDGVTAADNIYVANTAKVIKALELRAKAMALQELQMKAYEEYYSTIINADNTVAGGGYYHQFKAGTYSTDAYGNLPDEWKKAGVTMKEAGYEWGGGQSGMGFLKPTKAAIDKINAYRQQQARSTSQKIRTNAQAELDKTVNYTRRQLQLTEDKIASLNVLKAGGGGGGRNGGGGTGGAGGTGKTESELYAEDLAKKKALYQEYLKWITSSDETVRNAAASEFASLLAEGSSYLDYLERQRDTISAKASKTGADLRNLSTLNNEIANATRESVISAFDAQLQQELAKCNTLSEMLATIERRRSELSGDNSDVDNAKAEILKKAEDETKNRVIEETAQMLRDYSDYLGGRLNKAQQYVRQISALKARLQIANTQEERDQINAAIEFYGKLYDLHIDSAEELQEINAEAYARFATFEQKKLQIAEYYNRLIGAARLKGDKNLAKKLEGARDIEILKETKAYKELFNDLSNISVTTVENTRKALIAIIKSIYEQGKITAEDYKKLLDDINKKADSVYQNTSSGWQSLMGNTKGGGFMNFMFGEGDFSSKISDFQNMFSGAKDNVMQIEGGTEGIAGNMQGAGQGAAQAIARVDTIIRAVYQTLRAVSDTLAVIADYQDSIGKSGSADTLRDWGDCINAVNETAMSGWENLKSGNVMGAISDTISMPFKLLTTLNKIHDKHIDKSINRHSEAVRDLTNAYNQLEWQIDKALGEDVYKNQTEMINNLREQKQEIIEMQRLEESKKNSDSNKVAEYIEQQAEIDRQIQDAFDKITEGVTQTSVGELAGQIKDALMDAFESGEDAAKAFGDIANDVLKNAVANALKLQFLEKPLQQAIKQLQKDMGFDEEGNGSFDGLSESEQKRFKEAVEAAGANFQAAMEMYKGLFEQLDDSDPTTLSGAIKGASQESIDLLAGQTNAVRQNQVTQLALFRQQLIHVSNIDANVGVIAGRLLSILNAVTSPAGTSLRSQGITD